MRCGRARSAPSRPRYYSIREVIDLLPSSLMKGHVALWKAVNRSAERVLLTVATQNGGKFLRTMIGLFILFHKDLRIRLGPDLRERRILSI